MPARPVRLAADPLECRTVPSTVTVTQTARALDFQLQGTEWTEVRSTAVTPTGSVPLLDTYNGTVTATGKFTYTDARTGDTGTVQVSGSGQGTSTITDGTPKPTGATGDFARLDGYTSTSQGTLVLHDDGGAWTTTTPFAATETWDAGHGKTTSDLGSVSPTGQFDPSSYTFRLNWDATDNGVSRKGGITGTVVQPNAPATDLAFGTVTASADPAGVLQLDIVATVTGKLMKATSEGAAATHLTAEWRGNGQTQAADLDVPVNWNAGRIEATVTGLTPPSWATDLVLKLDAADAVAEGNESNNTYTVSLASLQPQTPPTTTPPPDTTPTPPADTPPPAPPPAPPTPTGFSVTPIGQEQVVQFRGADGKVIGSVVPFAGFAGPVSIAVGDVNGDGVLDVAAAAGAGGAPRVRVIDGKTGGVLNDFFAFEQSFTGGVNVAVADVDGDGKADIVTGAGEGGGPVVKVFDGNTGGLKTSYFAYEESFRGGVNVAATDLDGDGKAEVITGAGEGGGAVVKVFNGATGVGQLNILAGPEDARHGAKINLRPDGQGHAIVAVDLGDDQPVARYLPALRPGDPLLNRLADLPPGSISVG